MDEGKALAVESTDDYARTGYCITAICNGDELLAPGPGWFYREVETAIADAILWIYHHGYKDVKRFRFTVRKRRGRIARLEVYFLGAPGVRAIVAMSNVTFTGPRPVAPVWSLRNFGEWNPWRLWRGD
jgi:hypothetical protein